MLKALTNFANYSQQYRIFSQSILFLYTLYSNKLGDILQYLPALINLSLFYKIFCMVFFWDRSKRSSYYGECFIASNDKVAGQKQDPETTTNSVEVWIFNLVQYISKVSWPVAWWKLNRIENIYSFDKFPKRINLRK